MKTIRYIIGGLWLLVLMPQALSQDRWDDQVNKSWPDEFELLGIPSTMDGESQPAFFYSSVAPNRPLIVSLHTWSGGYDQRDTLSWMALKEDFNYIHPDFHGPNNNPKACGSPYVIQDIEDAIAYAIENGNVDPEEIHVTGVSGGGFATMLTYMNTHHRVRTFSAWVGISDLEKWYYESEGRGNKYSFEISQSTTEGANMTKDNYYLGVEEARKRSPIHYPTPTERRQDSKLFIYAGIHDGYRGSVPVTQSLDFYNKVVSDWGAGEDLRVPDSEIITLLTSRSFPATKEAPLGSRQVHYRRVYKDKVELLLFEGGHERVQEAAMLPMKGRRLLVIGDSNGAAETGWVNQLQALRFADFIHNTSISGNTIGFDNLDNPKLNTLRNVDRYLDEGSAQLNGLTDIVIMLGTNDCKAVFDSQLEEVPENLRSLISKIKDHASYKAYSPNIHIVSPPPQGADAVMLPKYHGGADRVGWLQEQFRAVAGDMGCQFIDVYSGLLPSWDEYAPEGIHPLPAAQKIIAQTIDDSLSDQR